GRGPRRVARQPLLAGFEKVLRPAVIEVLHDLLTTVELGVIAQEVAGGVCTVDFETLMGGAVLMGKPHVVKHRSCIKQFGIESESATLACQSAPVVDAARMVKEQRRFGVPHQLHYVASELAVGNSDPLKIDIHCMSP